MRCTWATTPSMIAYHDEEWGRPLHDDTRLFEFLVLEGAQAGLSWSTILNKRDRYRRVFAGFDPAKVARFSPARVEHILKDAGIVRNRAKVEAAVRNARAFLSVQREFGSFDAYLWRFVDGKPVARRPRSAKQVPTTSPQAEALSKDLRARGFGFVGPTICYAFMQAVGVVNDHLANCHARSKRQRAGDARAIQARLRFDKVAMRVVGHLQTTLGKLVPGGVTVLVTIAAPIRVPSKTAAEIEKRIRGFLTGRSPVRDAKLAVYGNHVVIRVLRTKARRSAKLRVFVHGADVDPVLLLNQM